MIESAIPVSLYSAGQVFACLGFLEASDVLCGDAEARFEWSNDTDVRFLLRTNGSRNPFATVLNFLATVEVTAVAPHDWRPKPDPANKDAPASEAARAKHERAVKKLEAEIQNQTKSSTFPAPTPDKSVDMPIQLTGHSGDGRPFRFVLSHWADGSSRNEFKLYAGNRSALDIAKAMLLGTFAKPRKGQNIGDLKTRGVRQLWEDERSDLIESPLGVTTPIGGSFNFDARAAWTAMDAGYSPNDQAHQVSASPVVEILAAWGMENARPYEFGTRMVRYAVWGHYLSPPLARAALCGQIPNVPTKRFHLKLDLAGKNKVVTYAEEEI